VLLDRSSSLTQTDPDEYSDSIAKALADLWPGKMAVIFFSGTDSSLPELGPVDLNAAGARDTLKQQIENQRNTLQVETPTQLAVEQAQQTLANAGYPTGSQVVLITDGQPSLPTDPNGTTEIQTIEQQDAPVFAGHHIPINTFGLGNQVPAYAGQFLQQVATLTGGTSQLVTDPAQLAKPVLTMYADWLGLNFVPTTGQNSFHIDTYASQVDFIAFLQNSDTNPVTLLGPNGQAVPSGDLESPSQDIHYQLDRLAVNQVNQPGQYTVQTSDPTAQIYALEKTRLRAQFVSPTAQTTVYAGQSLTVSAELYDQQQQQPLFPGANDATINLQFALKAGGKTVQHGEVVLTQQAAPHNNLFQTTITPQQTGTLTLTLNAIYQYVPVPDSPTITLPVTVAPWYQQYLWALILVGVLILVVLIIAVWLCLSRRPLLDGYINNGQRGGSVNLEELRARYVTNHQLDNHGTFNFGLAEFEIRREGNKVIIKTGKKSGPVQIDGEKAGERVDVTPRGVELRAGNKIYTDGRPTASASYTSVAETGAGWTRNDTRLGRPRN
jgi:hypothetical protein